MTDTNFEAGVESGFTDPDDDDEDYLQPTARRRVPWLTAVLAVGLVAGLAFTGGVLCRRTTTRPRRLGTDSRQGCLLDCGRLGRPARRIPRRRRSGRRRGNRWRPRGREPRRQPLPSWWAPSPRSTAPPCRSRTSGGTVHAVTTTSDTTLARTGLKASAALANGDTVTITGTKASDGAITATGITVR